MLKLMGKITFKNCVYLNLVSDYRLSDHHHHHIVIKHAALISKIFIRRGGGGGSKSGVFFQSSTYFTEGRESIWLLEGVHTSIAKKTLYTTESRPSLARQRNADEPTLHAGWVQGVRTSIPKEPYRFVIFQGVWTPPPLDPRM